MAWTLQFPRAQWVTDSTTIAVALGMRPQCQVIRNHSRIREIKSGPLLDFEIIPSEADMPLNLDFPPCGDAYIRESDLIAIYPQEYPWPFGYQVDFRYQDFTAGVGAIELWVSVSTSLLACKPKLHLIPKTRFLSTTIRSMAVADHGRAAFLIHPLDLADCEAVDSVEFSGIAHWDIFGGFMEKGVIRRSRFLFVWSDIAEPASTWDRLLDEFARSPLPLTA